MIRAGARQLAAVGAVVVLLRAGELGDFALCSERTGPERARRGDSPLTTSQFAYARADERLVVCGRRHCAGAPYGELFCHDDVACYCAPRAESDADALASFARDHAGAESCAADDGARCPRGRCATHLP